MIKQWSLRYSPVAGLAPGPGWSGATPQPDAIGEGAGANRTVIARWNVVPNQTVAGSLRVGVLAFHINGIDRVEISVDGGPWKSVSATSLNSDSNTQEYWTTFAAVLCSDGAHTLRAIVYPVIGVPRVLPDLVLYANSDGTLSSSVRYVSPTGSDENDGLTPGTPKATLASALASVYTETGTNLDGATIYLMTGTHTLDWPASGAWRTAPTRWLTISGAPGTTRSDVIVTGANLRIDGVGLVRFRNLTVNASSGVHAASYAADQLWDDSIHLYGADSWESGYGLGATAWTAGRYTTDCLIEKVWNGPQFALIVRGTTVQHILSDAFQQCPFVVNSTAYDLDPKETGAHSDVVQMFNQAAADTNAILYNITTPGEDSESIQGIYLESTTFGNVAVVNCNVAAGSPEGSYNYIFGGALTHVYVKNCVCRGKAWFDQSSVADVVFESWTITGGTVGNTDGIVFR